MVDFNPLNHNNDEKSAESNILVRQINKSKKKYLISSIFNSELYWKMENDNEGNIIGSTQIGESSKIHIVEHPKISNVYIMATERWKDWFIYMQSNETGNIRGWKSDPSDQGYFTFEKSDFSFKDIPAYKIKSYKWPNYYIYMEEGGNVRGCKENPGIKGYFIIQESQ